MTYTKIGLDIDKVVNEKMTKNKEKYPIAKEKSKVDKHTKL